MPATVVGSDDEIERGKIHDFRETSSGSDFALLKNS